MSAIDKPRTPWHDSERKRTANQGEWRRLFDEIRCEGKATDCEDIDALQSFFWQREGGVSVELGGLDGDITSMTKVLEKFGWKRVLIEANPDFRGPRKEKFPDAMGVQAAVCAGDAAKEVHYVYGPYPQVNGVVEFMAKPYLKRWYPELCRLFEKSGEDWFKTWQGGEHGGPPHLKHVAMPCASLSDMFSALGIAHVDLFILDVEGAELSVLQTVDWEKIRVDVLVIENDPTQRPELFTDHLIEMVNSSSKSAYNVAYRSRGRNLWLVRKDFVVSAQAST